MPISAEDVMQRVAGVFLNDPNQTYWTDDKIIPSLKYANDELGNLLTNHGVSVQRAVSVNVDVEIGDTELPDYPTDFFLPLELRERARDSEEDWVNVGVDGRWINPNILSSARIIEWTYRNNKIFFNPPTSQREVQLRYLRNIMAIVNKTNNIEIDRSINFLASRTAELCARFVGRNPSKADEIKVNEVGHAQHMLINSFVRISQKVRRRPYRRLRL